MPDRWGMTPNPNQKSTDFFIMQVFRGDPNLGKIRGGFIDQKIFKRGTPDGRAVTSNAEELNDAKHRIAQTVGRTLTTTGAGFKDIWEDANGDLFYYEWNQQIGNVKTIINMDLTVTKAKLTLMELIRRFV